VLGSIALEVADDPGPLPPKEARVTRRRQVFAEIPPGLFPRSAACHDGRLYLD
jgi:hypothetical protein